MSRSRSSPLPRACRRLRRHLIPVVLVTAVMIPAPLWAQSGVRDWNQSVDPLQAAVGLHYGQIGGHGLSFRLPVRWFLYLQVAGGVWHTTDKKQHNVGFNVNYMLRQDARMRLFVSAGTGYFYRRELTGTSAGQDVWDTEQNWNVGGGVGLEYLQGERWAWKIEADFAHLGKSGDIKVVPQAGLSYYW